MPEDFKSIRSWDGSKSRAFEEISYQLAREPSDLPPGNITPPIRTGNPDGGVEWYTLTADGKQWGWQAKYIFEMDTLLDAMTETVNRVVKERKNLTQLTFCIPWNLPDGTYGGKRKSARQRYKDKVDTWKETIEGAKNINFILLQESDLLARLALPKHAGRAWFWWNQLYLGLDWLEAFRSQQVDIAGDRYRPELQVDLPIQDDLSALGFATSFFHELNALKEHAAESIKHLSIPSKELGETLHTAASKAVSARDELASVLRRTEYQASEAEPLKALLETVEAALSALMVARDEAYNVAAGTKEQRERLDAYTHYVQKAWRGISSLQDYLNSPASHAVQKRRYFLTGGSGIGKTHLLLDSVKRGLAENRPSLVLFGNRFGNGDLWASICDQLGLPTLGGEVLLGAFEAVAEASSKRFVLAVDALNDTVDINYWSANLPALTAALSNMPLLALAVSCRDTYVSVVDPEDRRSDFTLREHPGFAGKEYEATHKYFQHYGLDEPMIPLLLPEFTVPLFLLAYCEGLKGEGKTAPPAGHEGRIQIFERFLKAKVAIVTRKLRLTPGTSQAREALNVLLEEMANTGSEYVDFDRAKALTASVIPERTEWPDTALGVLLSEGLMSDEMAYLESNTVRAVRVTYQAFSDYLILDYRLKKLVAAKAVSDKEFVGWLSKASWGLREAAAILLPERQGIELPDLLEEVTRLEATGDNHEQYTQYQLNQYDEMVLRSLPYRDSAAITSRTRELVNRYLSNGGSIDDLYETLLMCSPLIGSLFNGEGLHQHLSKFSMAQRDARFSVNIYHKISESSSALTRLGRWASHGPYPKSDPQVIELACIPLIWALSSPNRFMRDWLTKSLVELLRGHIEVAGKLINRFINVNDPYVLERLMSIAYGALLRGGMDDAPAAKALARQIEHQIFGQLGKLTPDALMIDAARGCIEWAVHNKLIDGEALSAARPPYGFKPPSNPLSKETLEKKYPFGTGAAHTGYGSILSSVMGMGDFARYAIEPYVHNFSKTLLTKAVPKKTEPKPGRFVVARWKRFLKTLSPKQLNLAAKMGDMSNKTSPLEQWSNMVADQPKVLITMFNMRPPSDGEQKETFFSSLTSEQVTEYLNCWDRPTSSSWKEERYPEDRAQRWILQRTMALGWKPELFGSFDYNLNYREASRTAHKGERFGKKYQWIALHELMARIADNYHVDSMMSELKEFDGLYQFSDREIDPSLPPVPYDDLHKETKVNRTWPSHTHKFDSWPPAKIDFGFYNGDKAAYLDDRTTLPLPKRIAKIVDNGGINWLLLDALLVQKDATDEDAKTPRAEQSCRLVSWLVPSKDVAVFARALPEITKNRNTYSVGHANCCYMGELGWTAAKCPHRNSELSAFTDKGRAAGIPSVPTIEEYSWSSELDCSIGSSVSGAVPSTFLYEHGGLRWDGGSQSWLGATGKPAIVFIENGSSIWANSGLLVREDWISDFLKREELALVWDASGERRFYDASETYRHPWLEFHTSAYYSDGSLQQGSSSIKKEDLE